MTARYIATAVGLIMALGTSTAADPFVLSSGDVLSISISRFPELDRSAMIAADGAVRVGGGDAVPVAGLTLDAAQMAVAQHLSALLGIDTMGVLVDIARYRPVVVFGAGRRGGETEYRPGLTVLQAVGATSERNISSDRSLLEILEGERSPGRLATARDRLAAALSTQERLLAERDNKVFVPVDLSASSLSEARRAEITASERAVYDLRAQRLSEQLNNLELQENATTRQISSLEEEMVLHREREAFLKEELTRIEGLDQRGLTTSGRVTEARSQLVDVQLLVVRIIADRAQAESQKAVITQTMTDLQNQRRLDIAEQLEFVEAEVAAAREGVASAVTELNASEAYLGGLAARSAEVETAYVLHRIDADGVMRQTEVSAATPLAAGDVIEVVRR